MIRKALCKADRVGSEAGDVDSIGEEGGGRRIYFANHASEANCHAVSSEEIVGLQPTRPEDHKGEGGGHPEVTQEGKGASPKTERRPLRRKPPAPTACTCCFVWEVPLQGARLPVSRHFERSLAWCTHDDQPRK